MTKHRDLSRGSSSSDRRRFLLAAGVGASSLLAASGPARAASSRSPGQFPLFGFLGWFSLHDYPTFHDAVAAVDLNVAMTSEGRIVELQGAGENGPFSRDQLLQMLDLAEKGIKEIIAAQREALGI